MPPYEGTSFLSPGVEQLHVTNCTYPYNESGNWKENIRCYNSKNHEESVFSPGKQEKLEGQNMLKSKVSLTATGLAMKEALREREKENFQLLNKISILGFSSVKPSVPCARLSNHYIWLPLSQMFSFPVPEHLPTDSPYPPLRCCSSPTKPEPAAHK